MDFFSKCLTKEDAKKVFHKLCMYFHPDKGGEQDLMIELKNQYNNWRPMDMSGKRHETDAFCYTFASGGFNTTTVGIYEKKLQERDGTIFELRQQIEQLKMSMAKGQECERDAKNAYFRINDELKKQNEKLEETLEDFRNIIEGIVKKRDNMNLADKIRFVFWGDR